MCVRQIYSAIEESIIIHLSHLCFIAIQVKQGYQPETGSEGVQKKREEYSVGKGWGATGWETKIREESNNNKNNKQQQHKTNLKKIINNIIGENKDQQPLHNDFNSTDLCVW